MSAVGSGGNYVSDGAIMSWLAEQQNRLYGDLRESIDVSQTRAQFADDLTDIKAALQSANKSHDFANVDQLLQNLLQRYGDVEGLGDVCEGLRGMADTIRSDMKLREEQANHPHFDQRMTGVGVGGRGYDARLAAVQQSPIRGRQDPGPMSYDDKTIDAWTNLIGDKLDVVNKNDQLAMIHIQELKASIDQSSQLGSSFISSGDKTSSAIINNIA